MVFPKPQTFWEVTQILHLYVVGLLYVVDPGILESCNPAQKAEVEAGWGAACSRPT